MPPTQPESMERAVGAGPLSQATHHGEASQRCPRWRSCRRRLCGLLTACRCLQLLAALQLLRLRNPLVCLQRLRVRSNWTLLLTLQPPFRQPGADHSAGLVFFLVVIRVDAEAGQGSRGHLCCAQRRLCLRAQPHAALATPNMGPLSQTKASSPWPGEALGAQQSQSTLKAGAGLCRRPAGSRLKFTVFWIRGIRFHAIGNQFLSRSSDPSKGT